MEAEKKNVAQLFGQNLRRYRKQAGLTQEQLSERLGISQKHLSIIENGAQFASASLIDCICTELNISVGALFGSSSDVNIKEVNMICSMMQTIINARFSILDQKLDSIEEKLKIRQDNF